MAKINIGLGEQRQKSPEVEVNKAPRLFKRVLLLAAGRALCVCLLDTFPQREEVLTEGVPIFV